MANVILEDNKVVALASGYTEGFETELPNDDPRVVEFVEKINALPGMVPIVLEEIPYVDQP